MMLSLCSMWLRARVRARARVRVRVRLLLCARVRGVRVRVRLLLCVRCVLLSLRLPSAAWSSSERCACACASWLVWLSPALASTQLRQAQVRRAWGFACEWAELWTQNKRGAARAAGGCVACFCSFWCVHVCLLWGCACINVLLSGIICVANGCSRGPGVGTLFCWAVSRRQCAALLGWADGALRCCVSPFGRGRKEPWAAPCPGWPVRAGGRRGGGEGFSKSFFCESRMRADR